MKRQQARQVSISGRPGSRGFLEGRGAIALAWTSLVLSAGFFCAALFGMAATSLAGHGDDLPFVSVFLLWGVVGAVIASRNPRNGVGWIFCGFALLGESTFAAEIFAERSAIGGLTDATELAGWYETWAGDWVPPLLGVLLLLLFPSGVLRTRLERWTAFMATAGFGMVAVASAMRPGRLPRHSFDNPFGIESLREPLAWMVGAGGLLVPLLFILALVALVRRLRAAQGDERAQLKWFAFAAGIVAFDLVLAAVVGLLDIEGGDAIGIVLFLAGLAGLAVATAIAILKYRLYDIDLVINRTLVYISLTVVLAAAYLGIVVLLQSAFGGLTEDSDLAVAGSTLAVAALFRPLRTRIQSFIDMRFYRRKYDAQLTLQSFNSRLREEVDLDHLAVALSAVVYETMQPAHVSVWLRPGGGVAHS